MRSFQILSLLLFLTVFLLASCGSLLNLKKIFVPETYTKIRPAFILLNAGVLFGFLFLYIYPMHPREASNYPVYFYFNTLFFTVFVFNLPMLMTMLIHSVFERKKKSPIIPYAGFILSLGLVAGILYGTFSGSRQMKIEHIDLTFDNLPENFNHFQIVQLSDLHLGGLLQPSKLLESTQKRLNELNPDLILFTGDLVNNFAKETFGFEKTLSDMNSSAESYSILGNHDYGNYTNWESKEKKQINFDNIVKAHHLMGFKLLNNEHIVLKKEADSVFLAGVENWGHPPFPQYADLEAALEGIPPDAFTILMTHDPAQWKSQVVGKKNIELTLAGHTHGLQWGIKLSGIPFSLAFLTRQNWGGLYKKGSQVLYVNTGLGTVGMPWRLDMPAEITVFTLKRGKVD